MVDPRKPRPGLGPIGDPIPGPVRPPRPPFGPAPWTPFGPGDNATPDVKSIVGQAARTRAALEKAQVELTRLRHGPGPDGTPPQVRDVSRADGLWPFLLIRTFPGDAGARPIDVDWTPFGANWKFQTVNSPDILLATAGPPNEPSVIGRTEFLAMAAADRFIADANMVAGVDFDLWVHVWNLGRGPATGVRVRTWAQQPTDPAPGQYLGGASLNLGDRTSENAHRLVKVGKWNQMVEFITLWATVECMTDVSGGSTDAGRLQDRHTAARGLWV